MKVHRKTILVFWFGLIAVVMIMLLLDTSPMPRGIWYGVGFAVLVLTVWSVDNLLWGRQRAVYDKHIAMYARIHKIGWNPLRIDELKALLPECKCLDAQLDKDPTRGRLADGVRDRIEIIERFQHAGDYYLEN